MYWGHHLVLNVRGCCPKSIRTHVTIWAFSQELVQKIKMIPFGKPQIQHFGSGDKAGYTLVQLIETSNICAHFVEETNDAYIDVFSCKPFDSEDVEEIVKKHFKPEKINSLLLKRGVLTELM